MIVARAAAPAPTESEARTLLADTAQAVKVMKASWLRVALNLKKIRKYELWRLAPQSCASFDEYVYGVLQLNRGVTRRMLGAVDYAEERRPSFLHAFAEGEEDVHVPSYDTLNQLRRAEPQFEGREEEFADLESRVYEEGMGRTNLKKVIEERLGKAPSGDDAPAGSAERSRAEAIPTVADALETLKELEQQMLKLDVPKKARRLLFELIELLDKQVAGRG